MNWTKILNSNFNELDLTLIERYLEENSAIDKSTLCNNTTYISFRYSGVELIIHNSIITAIVFYVLGNESYCNYEKELPFGLSTRPSLSEIRNKLKVNIDFDGPFQHWIKFPHERFFVHLMFEPGDPEHPTQITLQLW